MEPGLSLGFQMPVNAASPPLGVASADSMRMPPLLRGMRMGGGGATVCVSRVAKDLARAGADGSDAQRCAGVPRSVMARGMLWRDIGSRLSR